LTGVSVVIAVRTYVLNSRRALRDQASHVLVKVHQTHGAPDIVHTAVVTNHSKAPIWRVVLTVHRYTTTEISERELVIAPDESFSFATEPFWWEKYAPGTIRGGIAKAPLYGVVSFVDAQGYMWRRSSTGVLSPPSYIGFLPTGSNWRARWGRRFYRFRKAAIPTPLRHWFRNRRRAYLSAKPKRYRGSEKDL